jgi:hypothetical protein
VGGTVVNRQEVAQRSVSQQSVASDDSGMLQIATSVDRPNAKQRHSDR